MSARYRQLRRTSRWLATRGTPRWKRRTVRSTEVRTRNKRAGCPHPNRFCHVICPSKPAVKLPGMQRECPARTCWSALVEEARHDG